MNPNLSSNKQNGVHGVQTTRDKTTQTIINQPTMNINMTM